MKTLFSAVAGSMLALSGSASAAVAIDVRNVDGGLRVMMSGTLDTTGFVLQPTTDDLPARTGAIFADPIAGFSIGDGATDLYEVPTDSIFRFADRWATADTSVGSAFALYQTASGKLVIELPKGYRSGDQMAASMTFNGRTIESLGIAQGRSVLATPADTITLFIGDPPAVPEPASWAMMILGFGAVGAAVRRRAGATAGALA